MNLKLLTEPFPENEIEWRIGQAGKKGNSVWATCLAYVQARAIMNRLDSTVGPQGWRVEYRMIQKSEGIDAGVIATLSIKCGDEWVAKEDGAEQTDIESFKGGMSSALKRVGAAWGIGRYLYDLESGFAQIVQNGTQGSRWGKTKDGTEFHWLPPHLPQWALPAGHASTSNGVHPEQPGNNDGVHGHSAWTFTFGKFARYTVEQIYNDPKHGPGALASYVKYLEDSAKKKGETLNPRAQEAVDHISDFLGAMENAPSKINENEIPF